MTEEETKKPQAAKKPAKAAKKAAKPAAAKRAKPAAAAAKPAVKKPAAKSAARPTARTAAKGAAKGATKAREQKIRVRLQAFDYQLLDKSAQEIVLAAGRAGARVVGPVPLPVRKRRYDLLRSPHKDKTSREKIELREHIRMLDIVDLTSKTSNELMRLDLPPGVHAEVKVLN